MAPEQSFEEIVSILKSLRSVKGVVIEVKSEIFGVELAKSSGCPHPTYEGVIQSWKKRGEELYIKWPGYAQNKSVALSALENDSCGASLELRLKNYEDGSPPPVLYVAPAARQGEDGPGDLEGEEAGGSGEHGGGRGNFDTDEPNDTAQLQVQQDEDEHEAHQGAGADRVEVLQQVEDGGQVWRLRDPKYVKEDRRTEPRTKPFLNKGDLSLTSIADMFVYLTPDDWWDIQLRHTNPKLLGSDAINAKLTVGELKRWWGYALALSLNPGVPLERAWSLTPSPCSILPPMNMGRHGMSMNRWKKIRAVISFGPSDELALRADNWAFVRPLVDSFNQCRVEKFSPGWLIGVDELMSAWHRS
mmetsp:Transcript_36254/g.88209  ORF Transcript_36254/g.88209 Transcript_36254/m.88209 type:complete len:359 (+) Transcript_36254:480-1556(+)